MIQSLYSGKRFRNHTHASQTKIFDTPRFR